MVYGRVRKVWAKSILQDHCYSRLFVDKPVQVSGVDTKPEADKAVVEDEQKDPLEISEARDNNPAPDFVIRNVRTVVETNFNNKQPKAVQSVVIHSCQICYRPFPSQRLLDLHSTKEHMTSKTFSCQLCHVEFFTQAKLVKHEKKIHANLIDLKPDTECGRHGKPSEHQNFEKHLLIAHAGEDISECLSKNEQVFVNKSNLISEPDLTEEVTIKEEPIEQELQETEPLGCNKLSSTVVKLTCSDFQSEDLESREITRETEKSATEQTKPKDVRTLSTPMFDQLIKEYNASLLVSAEKELAIHKLGQQLPKPKPKRKIQHTIPKANSKQNTIDYNPDSQTLADTPTCLVCNKAISIKSTRAKSASYIHHECKPVRFQPYHCHICLKNFGHRYSLIEHHRALHPADMSLMGHFQCSLCSLNFTNKAQFKQHYNSGHSGLHYHCGDCKIKFKTEDELNEHTTVMEHKPQTYVCKLCFNEFKMLSKLSVHHSSQHPNVAEKHCLLCDKKFPTQTIFWRHVGQVHYKASCSYQCEFCGKDYNLLEYLKTHQMRVHATQKRLQCHLCVKSFCYQSMLNVHLSRRHPEASTAHTCNICNQEFRFLRLLQVHENQVHDAKHELKPKIKLKLGRKENFVCDICDKSFSTSVYMKRHKKVIHEKNGKYSCVHCGKKFGTKTYYDLHLNAVHLKKKSYKCRICQKDFKYPTGVHRHLKKQH